MELAAGPPVTLASRPHRLFLLGLMGSGKSAVAAAVGRRTGWPVLDNDVLLRGLSGVDAATLVRTEGVAALHAFEARVVERILAAPPPVVAGLPASAVDDPTLPGRLRVAGTAVWLRADPATLARRVETDPQRPLLPVGTAGSESVLAEQDRRRALSFDAAADVTVDVIGRDPDHLAVLALAAMAG